MTHKPAPSDILHRLLSPDDVEIITGKIIKDARRGERRALGFVMKHLERRKPLDIGPITTATDILAAQQRAVAAVAAGALPAREGLELAKMLDLVGSAIERQELEERLSEVERKATQRANANKKGKKRLARLKEAVEDEAAYIMAGTEIIREQIARGFPDTVKEPLTEAQQLQLQHAEKDLDALLKKKGLDRATVDELRTKGMLPWRDVELAMDNTDWAIDVLPHRTPEYLIWERMCRKNPKLRLNPPTLEKPPVEPRKKKGEISNIPPAPPEPSVEPECPAQRALRETAEMFRRQAEEREREKSMSA